MANNGSLEWTPPESNPGNGRGDPRPADDIMRNETSHVLAYRGGVKESRISLPPNANSHFSMATPYFTPAMKAHFLQFRNFNYSLNHCRPSHINHLEPVLTATPYNSCVCIWKGSDKTNVEYAQGQGQLRTRPGTVLYEGEFDNGFRHGYGTAGLVDGLFQDSFYAGNWKWGARDGWGKLILNDCGTVFEGFWKNDFMNGINRETLVDGSVYTGMFRNGRREGCGRFIWPHGVVEDHYYHGGRLLSKVVYTGKEGAASAAGTEPAAGTPPVLGFIEAFLQAKARQPVQPEGAPNSSGASTSSSSSGSGSDAAVDALTGPLKLNDKLATREIDEKFTANAAKDISKAAGKEITVKVDWASVNASEGPRKSVYTMSFSNSAYVFNPLAGAIGNLLKDDMTKEAFADKTKSILIRQQAAPTIDVKYEGETLVIAKNFEYGRGSEFNIPELQQAVEKKL